MKSNNRIAATLYSLGNIVCLRNISINTLHKGDDDDDDDNNNNNNNNNNNKVLINRRNQTALVMDIAVPLTHNLSKTEAQKITKYENLALEIQSIRKFNNISVYPLFVSEDRVVTKSFLKCLQNTGLTRYYLKSVAKNNSITNVSYSTQIHRTRLLILADRMNFLPLTESNPTDSPE